MKIIRAFTQRIHIPTHMLASYWKSGAHILTAVVIGKLISLVWKLYIARLGPTNLGLVEISMTVLFSLGSLSLLGFHTALMRFVTIATVRNASQTARALLNVVLRISLSLALCIIAFFLLFPRVLPIVFSASSNQLTQIQRYLWIIPVISLTEVFWSYLASIKHMSGYALSKYIAPPLFRLSTLAVLIVIGTSVDMSLIIHPVIAALLTFLFTLSYIRNHLAQTSPLTKQQLVGFISFALPMNASFVLFVLYESLDTILVARYLGTKDIGLLSALILIADVPNALFVPLLDIFQAHMGKAHTSIRKGAAFLTTNSIIFLMIASGICTTLFLLRHDIVRIFLGHEYAYIIPFIGMYLFLTTIETSLILPIRHFLDFYGYVRITLFLMILSFIIKVGIGTYTIPRFGLLGVIYMQIGATFIHMLGCIIAAAWVTLTSNQHRAHKVTR